MSSEEAKDPIFGSEEPAEEPRIPSTGGAGEMKMTLRLVGGGGVHPLFFKLTLAAAISAAGFLITRLRSPRRRPSPEKKTVVESSISAKSSEELSQLTSRIVDSSAAPFECVDMSVPLQLPLKDAIEEEKEEGFLLPEFNELAIKGFNFSPKNQKKLSLERDVESLKEMLETSRATSKRLESQLVENRVLRDREYAAMSELEKRVKIGAVESQLLISRIDSLQAENRELRDRAADRERRLSGELEAARETIRLLESKTEPAPPAALHLNADEELEKLMKGLLDDKERLKRANSLLVRENSALSKRVEFFHQNRQVIFSESIEGGGGALMESLDFHREQNAALEQEIEQLRTDRCADVEELVYLRWINACLRYELRNYLPPPERTTTTARDLSRTLSPESERKAKQLILDYAKAAGEEDDDEDRVIYMSSMDFDFDFDCWSSSAEDCEIASSTAAAAKKKSSFLRKLKRLIMLGKVERNKNSGAASVDNAGVASFGSASSCVTSAELQQSGERCRVSASSDDLGGELVLFRRRSAEEEGGGGISEFWGGDRRLRHEKERLKKYAEALSPSPAPEKKMANGGRRAASLSFG